MFIALEGLEGVGKTTIGRALAQRLNWEYIKTPRNDFTDLRGYIAKQNGYVQFYFYLSSLFDVQKEIARSKPNGVIVDRYILSTYAYSNLQNPLDSLFDTSSLIWPDVHLNIICNEETRIKRLELRGFQLFERQKSSASRISDFFSRHCTISISNEGALNATINSILKVISSEKP